MAKRGLCLLLALATVFSLTAPAFAEGEPADTIAPTEETVEAMEEPVGAAEEPVEITEEPSTPETVDVENEPVPAEVTASGSCGLEIGSVKWSLADDGTLTISGEGAMDGYSTTGPWQDYGDVTAVIIESGVTSIGNRAFKDCTSLASVTIPDSVTDIWYSVFEGCTSLKSVTIPATVTAIGGSAFKGCTGLTSVTIPGSVTLIGESAFEGCTGLTSVTIQEGVQSIDPKAFAGCTSLKSVQVPKSVQIVYSDSFDSTPWREAQEGDFFVINSLLCDYTGSGGEVVVPEGVTSLGGVFRGRTDVTSVTLPKSVAEIGYYEFADCTALESITIQEGIASIGNNAFANCKALKSVTIPGSVEWVGCTAFVYCTGLASLTIGDGVETLYEGAFAGCTGLKQVTIPASVLGVGPYAFGDCTGLTSVTVLGSETNITQYQAGDGTEQVVYTLGDPGKVTVYGYDGSTAESYAKENGYTFESLNKTPEPTATAKPTAPAAPKVKSAKLTADGVKVTWGKVSGAAKYQVVYKTTGGWKAVKTTVKDTSYTVKGLKSGVEYTFSVRAIAKDGTKGAYDKTGKAVTYISAPTVKSATLTADGVKVTWGKVSGAAKYQVVYKTTGGWKAVKATVKDTSYTVKGLKSGVKYTFSVRAIAKDGTKSLYNTTGKTATYIAAPTVKSAKAVSGGVKVTWAKVSGVSKYQVVYKTATGKWKAVKTTVTGTSYTVKGLKSGTKYTFSVRAITKNGVKSLYSTTGKTVTYKK